MTDDRPPIDDELVSAVLDGEATAEQRALVEGSTEGRRRLAQLRAAADMVSSPPPALDPGRVDAIVSRALDAAGTPPRPSADDLAPRRAARVGSPGRRRRALTAAAAAIIAIVVVGGLALATGRTGTQSASDSASEAPGASPLEDGTGGPASEQADASSAAGTAADTDGQLPVDLGRLPDGAAVLAAWARLESDPDSSTRSPTAGLESAITRTPLDATCAVPPIEVRPLETWAVVAVAELPTAPVLVMADTATGPVGRVLVVDATTCAVVAERTP